MAVLAVLLSTALVSATTVDDGSSPHQKMRNLGLGNRAGRKGRFLNPLKSSKSSKKKQSEEPSAVPSSMPSAAPSSSNRSSRT
eukprot:CAMPEP_0116130642 /NCGR_PEP_ID=MMETSP0329-20121206/8589_1 /TAXON_ID=697910 /ORGANISM="Pseudo-nitzschia arenysensis, Strain B593" /LENGTH=82 /DNA_ID=CAMNT_0003625035 /DNA_START=631 /DNA_END=879 /DNA_ORIENTATION=+